jgi:2-succinyl-5-enolpyruvyl-6-hydroxy-3-cyclohexene-1-carboxylate synthase
MWLHLDERCAGFFALGLGKTTRGPAAVITTSGTATANLFPAVIEASQDGVPLLVLTADRPHTLRGTDANQTIDQSHLYGSFVRESLDAGEASVGDLRGVRVLACGAVAATGGVDPGPVHVNFPLDKPLEPVELSAEQAASLRSADPVGVDGHADGAPIVPVVEQWGAAPIEDDVRAVTAALTAASTAPRAGGSRGLIVAGPVTDPETIGPAIGDLARATGFPVLADPLSGVRFSEHCAEYVVSGYHLFLMSFLDTSLREVLKPDVIIRIGGAPVSSSLLAFLSELAHVPQVRITSRHCWKDDLGVASLSIRADVASFIRAVTDEWSAAKAPASWRERWREIDQAARQAVCDFRISDAGDAFEGDVLAAVVAGVPEGTTLFVSNSMPVRDLDAYGGGEKPLRVYGNRGASGIDGIVSTVAGIAAASDGRSPIVAVVGDVAFYHDMNGLFAVARHRLDIVFVVINNDGGGIFHVLPIRDFEPEFTKYFATPHGLDFYHAAQLYGIPYRRVDHPSGAADALREVLAGTGPRILEVGSDRDQNQRSREAVAEAVRRAVMALL